MKAKKFQVGVNPDLLTELRSMLGTEAVRLGEMKNGRNNR